MLLCNEQFHRTKATKRVSSHAVISPSPKAEVPFQAKQKTYDKRIRIIEILLEGIDGEQGEVGLLLGVAEDVDVDELPKLERGRGDVLDDDGEKGRDVSVLGDQLHPTTRLQRRLISKESSEGGPGASRERGG
jgi:hypothetical protein